MASTHNPDGPEAPRRNVTDAVDLALLHALREDGRLSVAALAEAARVSRATAYVRLARLRERGVLRGVTIDCDPALLGLDVSALVTLTIEQASWRAVRRELLTMPEVEYVALAAGTFDVVALVRVQDVEALRDLVLSRLQGIPAVRSTETILVLDEARKRSVLPPLSPFAPLSPSRTHPTHRQPAATSEASDRRPGQPGGPARTEATVPGARRPGSASPTG